MSISSTARFACNCGDKMPLDGITHFHKKLELILGVKVASFFQTKKCTIGLLL